MMPSSCVDELVPIMKYSDFVEGNPVIKKQFLQWYANVSSQPLAAGGIGNVFQNMFSIPEDTTMYGKQSVQNRACEYQKNFATRAKEFIEGDPTKQLANMFDAWWQSVTKKSIDKTTTPPPPPPASKPMFGGRSKTSVRKKRKTSIKKKSNKKKSKKFRQQKK